MVDMMLQIMQGVYKGHTKLTPSELMKTSMEAAAWLMDRGFGKSPQPVDLDVDVQTTARDANLEDFSIEDLREIRGVIRQRVLTAGVGPVLEATVVEVKEEVHG